MTVRKTTQHDIQRDDENITRPGFDVITNILVSGTLSMAYTGVDQGTGQVILYSSGTPFDPSPYLLTSQFLPTLTGTISTAPSKNPPVGSDSVIIQDGERVTFTNLRTFFKSTYDTLYQPINTTGTFSPSWTNLTVGNGTVTGFYQQDGNVVNFHLEIVFGTTTSIAGSVSFSPPISHGTYPTNSPIGIVRMQSGGVVYFGALLTTASTTFVIVVNNASSTYLQNTALSSTIPGTWTTGDSIYIQGSYFT